MAETKKTLTQEVAALVDDTVINENRFKFPSSETFEDEGNFSADFYKELKKSLKTSTDPTFYLEDPPGFNYGYNEDLNVFTVKVTPNLPKVGDDNDYANVFDGDTMDFILDNNSQYGGAFDLWGDSSLHFKDFKDFILKTMGVAEAQQSLFNGQPVKFSMRSIGLDAPEVPHMQLATFTTDYVIKNLSCVKRSDYLGNSNYNLEVNSSEEYANIIKLKDDKGNVTYYEIMKCKNDYSISQSITDSKKEAHLFKGKIGVSPSSAEVELFYLKKDESESFKGYAEAGMYGKQLMRQMMEMGMKNGLVVVIDAKSVNRQSITANPRPDFGQLLLDFWTNPYKFWMKDCYDTNVREYIYPTYNMYGEDIYKRRIGVVYVKYSGSNEKLNGRWINVNKYILAQLGEYAKQNPVWNADPIYRQDFNLVSTAFKPWTYDIQSLKFIDALDNFSTDDRHEIQKKLIGTDFTNLTDHTIMIGDCLFMVPPTSIRCVSQNINNRQQLLRAKGSVTKSSTKLEKLIEMDLYFNENEGINGIPYNTTTPNGTPVVYYMNGLRSLIAMFKFTPFLPIENDYINNVLQVQAVCLSSLNITTVQGYPNLLCAKLVLEEFCYGIYMPDIPIPNPELNEDINQNMFAKTIDFNTMRWYYQRAIAKGEKIKGMMPTDMNYIKQTFGNKTALQPYTVGYSGVDFYIPDMDYLDKLLEIKEESLRHVTNILPTDDSNMASAMEDYKKVYDFISSVIYSNEVQAILEKINTKTDGKLYESVQTTGISRLCKVKNGQITVSFAEMYKHFEDLRKVFKSKLMGANRGIITDCNLYMNPTGDKFSVGESWDLYIYLSNSKVNSEEWNRIIDKIVTQIGDTSITKDNLLSYTGDGKIELKLQFKSKFNKPEKLYLQYEEAVTPFNIDTNSNSMKFLQIAGSYSAATAVQEENKKLKEKIDYEAYDSIEFKHYPIGDVRIANISCGFGNNLSKITTQSFDGYAPQYLGGQDTVIEIDMQTTDKAAATLIDLLPKLVIDCARNYRTVLTCWPLRIDSEITRLFGIYECAIESVDVSTVPNYPGLYTIHIKLMSVDRTMRNKEALKRLNIETNEGSTAKSAASQKAIKDYFDIEKALAQAEVYPDLELPTIPELFGAGFGFLKYLNKNRIYPDPDFYFVYNFPIQATILRKTINTYLSDKNVTNDSGFTYDLIDTSGAAINIKPIKYSAKSSDVAYKKVSENTKAKEQHQSLIDFTKIYKQVCKENNVVIDDGVRYEKNAPTVTYDEMLKAFLAASPNDSWNICSTIKCAFKEKRYEQLFANKKGTPMDKINTDKKKVIAAIDRILNKEIKLTSNLESSTLNAPSSVTEALGYLNGTDESPSLIERVMNFITGTSDNENTMGTDYFKNIIEEELGDDIKVISDILSLNEIIDGDVCSIDTLFRCANAVATGNKTYESGLDSKAWEGKIYNEIGDDKIPIAKIIRTGQSITSSSYATSWEQAMANSKDFMAITFGPFQTQLFTAADMKKMVPAESFDSNKYYFLDDFYRKTATDKQIQEYKYNMLRYPRYAVLAFFRTALFWIRKLVDDDVMISLFDYLLKDTKNYSIDDIINLEKSGEDVKDSQVTDAKEAVIRNNLKVQFPKATEDEINKKVEEELKKEAGSAKDAVDSEVDSMIEQIKAMSEERTSMATDIKKFIEDNSKAYITGKMFTGIVLALCNGDDSLYNLLTRRDYPTLNGMVQAIQSGAVDNEITSTKCYAVLNKYIMALVGNGFVDEEYLGSDDKSIAETFDNAINEKIYLARANDPSQYLAESFYDMIANDKRGRMLRAFPTFYMLFVDEGREIGLWKLHDNFYNVSAISEMQIVKSRKIPADTATITLTNMFSTFTTDDRDFDDGYKYTWKDAFNSIFSPRSYYLQEELRRKGMADTQYAKLQPGVRIHIRLGYGADASSLPTVFNGCIAEVGTGELIQIVAQGDGIELSNPILVNADAEDAQHGDDFVLARKIESWITKGATPRNILSSLITNKGGFLKSVINKNTNGRFFQENPYGIVHFGDLEYREFFNQSECTQNIYEACSSPSFGDGMADYMADQYGLLETPKISTQIFGKSYWDLMNICASASPDFICSIVPFGMRSSIFYGAPRYYYAYEYAKEFDKDGNPATFEKRKPFQQYHIYTSYSDIIGNGIAASDRDVKTCAVGIYSSHGWLGKGSTKQVGPLYVDFNIYPEKQKTMTVDTQYVAKGSLAGDFIPFLDWAKDKFASAEQSGGYQIAWRMTASALKKSVMDMYQGELVVLGDPTVKPYDKMYIYDLFEKITGACDVEAVVHTLSVENGYTTSINPDCIAVIDDRYEQIARSCMNNTVAHALALYGISFATTTLFTRKTKPLLSALTSFTSKGVTTIDNITQSIEGLFSSKEKNAASKFFESYQSTLENMGIGIKSQRLSGFIESMAKAKKTLSELEKATSIEDVIQNYSKLNKSVKDLNASKRISELETALNKASKDEIPKINEAIKELRAYQTEVEKVNLTILNKISPTELTNMKAALTADGSELATSLIKEIDDIGDISKITKAEDATKTIERIMSITNKIDNSTTLKAIDASKLIDNISDACSIGTKAVTGAMEAVAAEGTAATEVAGITSLGASMSGAAIFGALIPIALEVAATWVIQQSVYEYIERWVKNQQVLQIFPLMKYSYPLTAGLDGSKGLVVGSPSYNQLGPIQEWLADTFGSPSNPIAAIAESFFISDEVRTYLKKYKDKEVFGSIPGQYNAEMDVQNILSAATGNELTAQNYFNKLMLVKRIQNISNTEDMKNILKVYGISKLQTLLDLANHPEITKEMVPLTTSREFNNLIKQNYVILLHEASNVVKDNAGKTIIDFGKIKRSHADFNLDGNTKEIGCLVYNDDSTDWPFLRMDAYLVMMQILNTAKNKMNNISQNYNKISPAEKNKLVISSALVLNDKNTIQSTGFAFRVRLIATEDKYKNVLAETINEMIKTQTSIMNEDKDKKVAYRSFKATAVKEVPNCFDIIIYPPTNK